MFTLWVTMRIVRHCSTLPNAIHLAEIGNYFVVKRHTLITMDPSRYSKHTKPFFHKNFGHGKRLLVIGNKCLTILGEGICENKNVLFAPPLHNVSICKIDAQQLQGLVSYQTTLDCFWFIIVSFGNKTPFTLSMPVVGIHEHSWPIDPAMQ